MSAALGLPQPRPPLNWKIITFQCVGHGHPTPGGSPAHKAKRFAILDELATFGNGLTDSQKGDNFTMFKESWDEHMLETYGHDWPHMFLLHCHRILEQMDNDPAVFSNFVYNETRAAFIRDFELDVY